MLVSHALQSRYGSGHPQFDLAQFDQRLKKIARGRTGLTRVLGVCRGTTASVNLLLKMYGLNPDGPTSQRHPYMMIWATHMLRVLGIDVEVRGDTPQLGEPPTIYIGNHISYLDIPLLMSLSPVVFVAKKQLEGWPVFGRAMKSVGTIFVDRDSAQSRKIAGDSIGPKILQHQQSVVIFPSGTTTLAEDKPWRWGALTIAKRYGIPIRPFRLKYEPLRLAAYIDQDWFGPHLLRVARAAKLKATIEFHAPIKVEQSEKDCLHWQKWSQEFLH